MADVLSPRIILIETLEDAAREMRAIDVSEGGIDAMTPKGRYLAVKVAGACVPAAHIIKQQMLSIGGEAAVARDVLTHGVDSTDIIIFGTFAQLRLLSEKLSWQPFDLPRLGERIAALLDAVAGGGGCTVRAGRFELDLGDHVHVMGILNVTPDSFSDGGSYPTPTAAVDRALEMVDEGADIIDIGGLSTRPGSSPCTEPEELDRIVPVVERLADRWQGPISVDTFRAPVAKACLDEGAVIINDVTALRGDDAMADTVASAGAACVLMHMRGDPETMQHDPSYDDLVGEVTGVLDGAVRRACDAGVGPGQIIVDPGLGFGKTTEDNLELLRRLPELASLGRPVLVGPSRKGFIGRVLDLPVEDRIEGTLATCAYAVAQGARIVRVHDVRPAVRTVSMVDACLVSGRREERMP
ncbi:MAG: dihydropteroate synthase [Candidatus Eisenbacteria bacterium]|nr:dihydropteroate synthase [Candidatus Eisenbacteria bacterium]